jgi:hypothetical protein
MKQRKCPNCKKQMEDRSDIWAEDFNADESWYCEDCKRLRDWMVNILGYEA